MLVDIIIPAAGSGKRFADKGYKEPKPFIKIGKRRLINAVLSNLGVGGFSLVDTKSLSVLFDENHVNAELIDDLKAEFSADNVLSSVQPDFIPIETKKLGMAYDALNAKHKLGDGPLVITDCDHLIAEPYWLANAIIYFDHLKCDGGFINFVSNEPKWSYIEVDEHGFVKRSIEKEVISNLANTGTYYFAKGSDFVKLVEDAIASEDKTKGEYYVAPLYNKMIAQGKRIGHYIINGMIALGTPEDFEKNLNSPLLPSYLK